MRTIDLDGITYAYDDGGSGPPILLLHGFMGSTGTWRQLLPALGRDHRTIAVDLLGHGRSAQPYDPTRYDLGAQSDDLAALLGELGLERAHVVGYSMGARLALRFVVDHPAMVDRLVIESPSAGIADPDARAARIAEDEALASSLEDDGIESFVDAWEGKPLFAAQLELPADVRAEIRRERLGNDPRALAASLRGAGQGAMEPLHDALAATGKPTLIIAGDLDRAGVKRARETNSALPDARLVTLADAGHAPHLERPDPVTAAIAAFLDPDIATDSPPTKQQGV